MTAGFYTISQRRLWDSCSSLRCSLYLNLTEIFILPCLRHLQKQTNNEMKKECSFRKHFAQSSALPAQPGCTVCRHSAFLDDKKHIPFHHNRPYLLKQSVQACRKNLPQNGTCSTYSIALKVFV